MESIPLGRQDALLDLLEEFLVNWTAYSLRVREMTVRERNWLFEYVVNRLRLPSLPEMLIKRSERQENVTMAHVGTIVQRKEKEVIAEDALDIFLGTNDQYCGYALPEDGEVAFGILDDVKADIATTNENYQTPYYLMFAKGADTEESKQPFNTLQNEGGNCICATFIEGDLQGFGSPESSHSIAFAAHQEYIQAKVIDIFNSCGEDLAKTIEKLGSNLVRREIINNVFPGQEEKTRGEILLVFGNGQTVNIVKGDKHKKYPWGEVSQSLGYEGKAVASEVVKKGMGKATAKPAPAPAASVPAVKSNVTAISAAMDKAKDQLKEQPNLNIWVVPPADKCKTFKEMQAWYKMFGHPDHMPADADIDKAVNKAHLAPPVKIKGVISNAAINNLLTQNKLLKAPDGSDKAPAVIKPKIEIPISIIPAAELEKAQKEFWPKIVKAIENYDDGSRLIVQPDLAADLTKTRPVATEQMGRQMGLEEFERLSADAWRMMVKQYPETIVSILMQYQYQRYMDHRAVKDAAKITKAM